MSKFVEDSEGRDGLILQQNQDIANLFENEKVTKGQVEELQMNLEKRMNDLS